jgi:5-(carboxyamino)imidazole ribonucleotide synthase
MTSVFSNPDFEIALLGGGQLGKMVLAEARRLDIGVRVLDPSPMHPAGLGAQQFTLGSFQDYDTVLAFAQGADAVALRLRA